MIAAKLQSRNGHLTGSAQWLCPGTWSCRRGEGQGTKAEAQRKRSVRGAHTPQERSDVSHAWTPPACPAASLGKAGQRTLSRRSMAMTQGPCTIKYCRSTNVQHYSMTLPFSLFRCSRRLALLLKTPVSKNRALAPHRWLLARENNRHFSALGQQNKIYKYLLQNVNTYSCLFEFRSS